jgi:hypothetical protein
MPVPKGLRQAYAATDYWVQARDCALRLRIGRHQAATLQRLRATFGLPPEGPERFVIATPCNPRSRQLPPRVNARRLAAGAAALRNAGLAQTATLHRAPNGTWPDEHGFCVCCRDALQTLRVDRLARGWGQHATVHLSARAVFQLRCLR